jgi:hypothetical protein
MILEESHVGGVDGVDYAATSAVMEVPVFLFHSVRSVWQVKRADGVQSAALLKADWRTYWTRTIWADEAAMKKFMISGNHRLAMPKLMDICDEASVARWTQDDLTPPPWDEVHRRMQCEGRTSKVNHPSVAQTAFQIPPPQLKPFSEIIIR